MNYWEGIDRFEIVRNLIAGTWIHGAARLPGDQGSWTRERAMPLSDILRCTLGKNGLTTVMELRHYFQETGEGVKIRWKNRSIILPAVVVPDAKDILLGALPLEAMDLMVDPALEQLVGVHGDQPPHVLYAVNSMPLYVERH